MDMAAILGHVSHMDHLHKLSPTPSLKRFHSNFGFESSSVFRDL